MKVALTTIGCKLNQFETQVMQELLEGESYEIIPFSQEADIYVINTCTVTGKSEYRARQVIRKALRTNPQAFIVVAGCYAQVHPQQVARLPEVDLILGNEEKFSLHSYLVGAKKANSPRIEVGDIDSNRIFISHRVRNLSGYTRAFVKIQDGCDASCAFCLVSRARGPNRSERPEAIRDQIEQLVGAGYQEVVLTGVHLGTYGEDLDGETHLVGLLRSLREITGLKKVRLSSIEPREFTSELIEEIVTNPKVCRHLHIPLQSGDSKILWSMERSYTPTDYEGLVCRLKEKMPELGLGADVIVGFPGEEEEHFRHTYELIERLPLTYLHIFSFSPRPGTPAADMPNQVEGTFKQERSQRLRALGKQKSLEFKRSYLGREVEVLVESSPDKVTCFPKAISENYLKVLLPGENLEEIINRYLAVRIFRLEGEMLVGTVQRQPLDQTIVI